MVQSMQDCWTTDDLAKSATLRTAEMPFFLSCVVLLFYNIDKVSRLRFVLCSWSNL